jgi:drug/metabolite transporter (DMT)-like permease
MLRTIVLITVNSIVWTFNSISFWQIGVKMPGYPIFANWITLIPYIVFVPFLFWRRTRLVWQVHALFLIYTILSAGDSVLEILADSNTGGVVQAICSTAVPIPVIAILTWVVFRRRPTIPEIVGSIIVMLGSALIIFESEGVYVNWWIIVYIGGLILGCIYTIIWEYIFLKYPETEVLHMMGWTTLYSLPLYFLTIFVNGANGFKCFVGQQPLPPGCEQGAWIPLVVYSLSSMVSDIVQLYFVKNDSAYFLIVADTLTTPLTAIVMACGWMFGASAEPITWYTIVSCVLIVIGIIVYKLDWTRCKRKAYIQVQMDPVGT